MPRKTICHRGRKYNVLRTLTIGQRPYHLLKRLSDQRERYLAYDPNAGPDGDLRAVWLLPRNSYTKKQIRVAVRISESNSNVPTILEYHESGRHLQVVATWIGGGDLASFLALVRRGRAPRPSPREALRLVRGLAHGISNLNQKKNVMHGDIKPANLVLAREPSRLYMIDFGSAWFAEETMMPRQSDGVTPLYSAPEQLDRTGDLPAPDFRSDQFATMVVFYEMLTLKLPYDGLGGAAGVDRQHRAATEHALVPPSQLAGAGRRQLSTGIWRRLDRLVARGLQLHPSKRFEGRRDWLKEFDQINAKLSVDEDGSILVRSLQELVEWPTRIWQDWRERR